MDFPFAREAISKLFSKSSAICTPPCRAKPRRITVGASLTVPISASAAAVRACLRPAARSPRTIEKGEDGQGDKVTLTFNLGSCTFCATCADFCSRKAIELTGDYHMIATKEEDLLVTGSFIKKPPVKKAAPAPAAKPAAEAPAAPAEAPAAEVRPRDDGKRQRSGEVRLLHALRKEVSAGAIEVDRANKTWKLDADKCVACGTCAEAWPQKVHHNVI